MSHKPEVFVQGEWAQNGQAFATEPEALQSAQDLARRWLLVSDSRAVPSTQPVNYQIVDGVLSCVAPQQPQGEQHATASA